MSEEKNYCPWCGQWIADLEITDIAQIQAIKTNRLGDLWRKITNLFNLRMVIE